YDGGVLLGTATGVLRLEADGNVTRFVLGTLAATRTAVFAIAQDSRGALCFGTQLGVFQYQPWLDHWYWYAGGDASEQAPDWQRFDPSATGAGRNFPAASAVFLPPVRDVHRGPDGALWLGTDAGLARYVGRSQRGR